YSVTQNAISRSESISDAGARVFQYINVNGVQSVSLYGAIGTMVKPIETRIGLFVNSYFNKNVAYINNQKNNTNNNVYGLGVNINKDIAKLLSFNHSTAINYNNVQSTLNTNNTQNFWTMNHNTGLTVELPYDIDFAINSRIDLRQKTDRFKDNNSVVY